MNSLETFEEYLGNEFGYDKVKNIQCHFLVTCSQLKPVMDHIFTNIYSKKSSKIVDFNLKLDDLSNKQFDCNNRLNDSANFRNKELKKKLNEMKTSLNNYQSEIGDLKFQIEVNQSKSNSSKNALLNKQIKCNTQKINIKTANEIWQAIENSTKIFDFVKVNQPIEKNIYFNDFKNQDLEHSLNKAFHLLNDEQKWIDQTTESFEADLELIKYRINSSNQLSILDETNLEIFDSINEINFDLLNKASCVQKYKEETQKLASFKNQTKAKFIAYLKQNYSSNSIALYGQYLKNFLMFKSVETNLNETVLFLKYLEDETKQLTTNTSKTNFTQIFLNDLKASIQEKHFKINTLFKDNLNRVVTEFQNNRIQIKSELETLDNLIQSFNLESLNKLDCSFNSPSIGLFGMKSNQILNKLIEVYKHEENEDTLYKRFKNEHFFNSINCLSKLAIFDKLIHLYNEIKKSLYGFEKNYKHAHRMTLLKEVITGLEQTISNVKNFDSKLQVKYNEMLKLKEKKLNSLEMDINEVEELKEFWIAQPAANICVFDSITVLGKDIKYYMNVIDERLANFKRLWLNQK